MKGYLVRHPDGDYRTHDYWGTLNEAYAYVSYDEAKEDADHCKGTIEEVDLEKHIRTMCMLISEAKEGFECLETHVQEGDDFKESINYVKNEYFWWANNE